MFIKVYFEKYNKNYNNSFIIFLSNLIYYRCDKAICYCVNKENNKFYFNKILIIDKDYISFIIFLKNIKFIINSLYFLFHF